MNCNKFYTDKECNTFVQDEYDSNYAYVYILQLNNTSGIINQVFIRTNIEDQIKFDLRLDGFYTLITLKVPINPIMPYYYKNGKFYKNMWEVELQELINVNPEISKVPITYEYYFQTCNLRKCYVNICQKIFDSQASIRCVSSNIDKELIYKRDLLWSALNVINYMVEYDQYEEAQRLLERITDCNGLCKNNLDNCGCS